MSGTLRVMYGTSERLLRLLSLLQARRDWPGADLAARLGVDVRTIRRDIERLRSLGYPEHATPGVAGGYRLGAGAALPPLLLDDDEAGAGAVGLRTAASGTVSGIEETSVRALAKLEQVLPARLRPRVGALQAATMSLPGGGPTVAASVLTVLASACRGHERLRFPYGARSPGGGPGGVRVAPDLVGALPAPVRAAGGGAGVGAVPPDPAGERRGGADRRAQLPGADRGEHPGHGPVLPGPVGVRLRGGGGAAGPGGAAAGGCRALRPGGGLKGPFSPPSPGHCRR